MLANDNKLILAIEIYAVAAGIGLVGLILCAWMTYLIDHMHERRMRKHGRTHTTTTDDRGD